MYSSENKEMYSISLSRTEAKKVAFFSTSALLPALAQRIEKLTRELNDVEGQTIPWFVVVVIDLTSTMATG